MANVADFQVLAGSFELDSSGPNSEKVLTFDPPSNLVLTGSSGKFILAFLITPFEKTKLGFEMNFRMVLNGTTFNPSVTRGFWHAFDAGKVYPEGADVGGRIRFLQNVEGRARYDSVILWYQVRDD